MDIVAPEQYVITAVFLLLLLAAAYFIRANSGSLSKKIQGDRRMRVTETTMLGQGERAVLLSVGEHEFLVVTSKRGSATVTPLEKAEDPA